MPAGAVQLRVGVTGFTAKTTVAVAGALLTVSVGVKAALSVWLPAVRMVPAAGV
jgi:hypothetical protein